MELMKESIEAIIDNIHEAEEYLVAEDIDDFLDIIVSANNVFV
jgi:6-phospho-3-hexuloisomerase